MSNKLRQKFPYCSTMHKALLKIYIYDFFVRHETVYNMCSILPLQQSEGYSGVLYRSSIHISVVYILRSLNWLKGGNFQPERSTIYSFFYKSHAKCECSGFVKYNVKKQFGRNIWISVNFFLFYFSLVIKKSEYYIINYI